VAAAGIGPSTAAGVPLIAVVSTGIALRSTGTSIGAVTEPMGAALGERPDATGDDGLGGTGLSDETDASAESGRAPVMRLGAGGGTGSERVPLGADAAFGSLTGRASRFGAGGGTLRRGPGGGFAASETAAVPAAAAGGLFVVERGGGLLRDGRGGAGAADTRGAPDVSPPAWFAGAALRLGAAGGIEFGRGRGGAGFFGEGESSAMTRVS
jgi:hypothetical protein